MSKNVCVFVFLFLVIILFHINVFCNVDLRCSLLLLLLADVGELDKLILLLLLLLFIIFILFIVEFGFERLLIIRAVVADKFEFGFS